MELNCEENELSTTIRNTQQVKNSKKIKPRFYIFFRIVAVFIRKKSWYISERIKAFLDQLVDNEFLISEMRPPLVNTDTLRYVIHILEEINFNSEAKRYLLLLTDIEEEIDQYNLKPIGTGLHIFESIISKMKSVYECKNCLQVDTKLKWNLINYHIK